MRTTRLKKTWILWHRATYSKGNIAGIMKKVNQFAEELAGTELALGPDESSQLGVMAESLGSADAARCVEQTG